MSQSQETKLRGCASTLLTLLLVGCSVKQDDSDPPNGHSGLTPLRDSRTGCEYLMVGNGGAYAVAITPRMDSDGKQICRGGVER